VLCTICDGTGWKPVEEGGVSRVVRCDCWKHTSAERLARDADIPPRYEKCDLDNFHDYNDSLSKAVGRARRFVDEFPAVDRGLMFVGRPGLGKTHLAIACLKLAAHSRGLRGIFYDTRELLRRIRQSYDPVSRTTESERDVVNAVVNADLLVLDDIGAERATEWVEEMLHLIVNARYNGRRPTIFTTNYPIETPSEAKHAETLLERVGFRMYSRLQEMSDFVHLEGVDYREAGPNPSAEQLAHLSQRGSRTHKQLPSPSAKSQIKSRFRSTEPAPELKWPGGRAGS
jgi:DNA replication protein DnaC